MTLDLGSGTYAFLCLFSDFDPAAGVKVTVPGHAKGTPAILPVTFNDPIPYAKKYQAYAEAGLKVLAGRRRGSPPTSGTTTSRRRSGTGSPRTCSTRRLARRTGRSATTTTRSTGGRTSTGVSSPQWTGFYRLEYGLWHGQSATC